MISQVFKQKVQTKKMRGKKKEEKTVNPKEEGRSKQLRVCVISDISTKNYMSLFRIEHINRANKQTRRDETRLAKTDGCFFFLLSSIGHRVHKSTEW